MSHVNRERFVPIAKKAGLSDEEIEALIADMDHETDALDRKECPKCNAPIQGSVDKRQDGAFDREDPFLNVPDRSPMWVNYRCGCGYMVDRVELVAS